MLVLLLLITPLAGFTQETTVYESVLNKLSDRWKHGILDSIMEQVIFFENYYKKLDAAAKCYIYPDTIHYMDGYTAIGTNAVIAQTLDELQTGDWIYYYPSGKIYAMGKFAIAGITQCDVGGPSALYYNYKLGPWK